ncbi:MAG: hypothetical protein N4A41_13920 [Crocinitomicaceae bacterium]|jgi:hypothetical protein|nr:hypothetical protein [Crocinitomicaceae bacterium]
MKQTILISSIVFLAACSANSGDKSSIKDQKVVLQKNIIREEDSLQFQLEYATYFVVIADTNKDYYFLRKKMFDMENLYNLKIDTMGRSYDKNKNLIALPANHEDEIYAGDYFPRRIPSEFLSLEYLSLYKENAGDQTIALIVGIYETEKAADSVLYLLKSREPKLFKTKSELYVGCLH